MGLAGGLAANGGGVPGTERFAAVGTTRPESYGAKGDGVILYNAVMTASSAVLNSTDAGVNFTSADIGKTIIVSGVGASNADLVTTIASVQSTSRCTLAATATVNSPDPTAMQIAVYGTDDTAAIQAASDAAALSNSGSVEFDAKTYILAGPLVQGGARKSNSQITLPYGGWAGNIGRLMWRGARDFSALSGNPPFPATGGTVLVSTLVGQTYSGTYGIPSVVGGPTQEQTSSYNGWLFDVEDLCLLTSRNPTVTAFNLERCSAQNRRRVTAGTLEWGFASNTWDSLSTVKPSHPWAAAFIDPMTSNFQGGAGRSEQICTWGYVVGIAPAEHSNITQYQVFNTYIPIAIRNGYTHAAKFNYITCQTNPYVVSGWDPTQATVAAAIIPVPVAPNGGGNVVLIDQLDLEDYTDTALGNLNWTQLVNHINDANNHLSGYVRFSRWTWAASAFVASSSLVLSGGTSMVVQPNNPAAPVSMLGQATIDALMPWTFSFVPVLGTQDVNAIAGTWSQGGAVGTDVIGATLFNNSAAQNDEVGFYFPMANGTWTFAIMFTKGSANGIYTVNLDGVSVGTIDGYNASTTHNNTAKITGFTVATAGRHLLSFKAATKNASSTGFTLQFVMFQLRRTA